MISNFEKFKNEAPEIYDSLIGLEKQLNTTSKYFAFELRTITEMVICSNKLKDFFPKDFNFINLGASFHHFFDQQNNQKLIELTKSQNNMNQLRNAFYDIKNFLNPKSHYNENESALDINGKISLLQKIYSILSLIYFGQNGLDFSYNNYFNSDFLVANSELKNYFKNYVEKNDLKEDINSFSQFLTSEVISDFYENENFDFNNLIPKESIIEKNDSVLLKFYDSTKTNNIILLKIHKKNSNYSLLDFHSDLSEIKGDLNYTFGFKIETNVNFFIFSRGINDENKSLILRDINRTNNLDNLNVSLLNETSVLNEYKFKNNEDLDLVKNVKMEMKTPKSYFQVKENSYSVLVAQILATSLAEAWKNSEGQILKKNIRGYIRNSKIDNAIRKTIDKNPSDFMLYNNGITAFAKNDKGNVISGKHLRFEEFFIINGGQTTKLISELVNESKEKHKFRDLTLMMKVIIPNNMSLFDGELINQISISSNQQKPIKNQDLHTNNQQLIKWTNLFNSIPLKPYKFNLKRETKAKNKNETIITLPIFLQLMVATIWANPVLSKNGKSKIFDFSQINLVGKTFKKVNLEIKDVQYFVYDILLINDLIDDYVKKLKKKDISEGKRKNLIKILTTGKFFIVEIIYIFHLIKNLGYEEKAELLDALKTEPDSKNRIELFQRLSDKVELGKILSRKEFGNQSQVSRVSEDTLNNLENLVSAIIYSLAEKGQWTENESKDNIELDWIGIFKNGVKSWEFINYIIKNFLNVELGRNESYSVSNDQRMKNLIDSCIA